MNPVVHFEVPGEDMERMKQFYSKAFGWTMNQLGPEMGNYVTVMTTEIDPATNLSKTPGAINGGFMKKMPGIEHPSVTIAVDDIRESMKKIEEAGGKITGGEKLGEPDLIQGVGYYISFMDTEGNRGSLLQPIMPATK